MSNNEEAVKNGIFPLGQENPYGQFFIGQSFLEQLAHDEKLQISVGNVSFEPGCRNNWHIHTEGYQILIVTAGEGWYQEAGKAAQRLKVGDVVITHKGVKHWHGATKDSWFSHLAITAGASEFLEAVSDEEYKKL